MEETIRCAECEYCRGNTPNGNTRKEYKCKHPNQNHIFDYFIKHNIKKMKGFIGFSKPYSQQVPIKNSPKWCPKKSIDTNHKREECKNEGKRKKQ